MDSQTNNQKVEPVIIMADNDEHIAFLLDVLLQRQGYRVIAVKDGIGFLELIKGHLPPALILLDIMLPFIDGFDLIHQIRTLQDWKGVPIIVLSSRDGEEDIVRAFKAGANDYITKPFQPRELVVRIENLLGRKNDYAFGEV